MSRRPSDPRAAAEAAFKPKRPVAPPPPKQAVIPGAREQVSLRLDTSVIEHFQDGGPGWQDRINEALRAYVADRGDLGDGPAAISVNNLSSENDDGAG